MNGEQRGTKSAQAILTGAMQELEEREQRLQVFAEEMDQVKQALKVLRKALAPKGASTVKGGAATGRNPRGEAMQKVMVALEDAPDPIAVEQVAEATGLKMGAWLEGLLKQAVSAGDAVLIDGRYGVGPALDRSLLAAAS
jgi:uncharacterized protein YwlG (UPF0340 family)